LRISQKVRAAVNTPLFVAGLGVVGVAIVAAALWYRGTHKEDLGSVSHVWIAELRAGDPYDSSR
jgi:hypothetical protein